MDLRSCCEQGSNLLPLHVVCRGADSTVQDVLGRTALDLAVAKGKMPDNELFVLLAPPESASPRLL